jgi:predicted outer membrane repeat protein
MITSNYSKRLGFLIFGLAFTLVMCGAAFAAPTNSTHVNLNQSVNHTTNQLNTTTNTKLPDPQVYNGHTYEGTYNTIADAINAAKSGDTIWLASGTTFDEHGLTVSKNLDFNVFNNGTATINAQGKGQVFFIVGSVTVELENLILENGKATDGGAIGNVGVLTVKDCTFKDNTATSDGGAISNDGVLTVNKSTFTGNTATGANGDGGAIYNQPMGFTLIGSTFTGNSANYEGGAVYNDGGALNQPVKISGNTFTGNKAFYGGAIYNDYDAIMTVTDSNFKDNTHGGVGGAIFNNGITLNVKGSNFTGNQANYGAGAIYNSDFSALTVTSSNFTGNTAGGGGGAIMNNGNLTLSSSTLISNTITGSNGEGGAIFNVGNAAVHFNRIVDNSASQGNDIYNFDSGKMNATLNWWGYNSQINIANQIDNKGVSLTYNPWIVLSIQANPVNAIVGGHPIINAALLFASNSEYYPATGIVPYTGSANFKTTKGTIKNSNFSNGVSGSTLTDLTTAEVVTVFTTVDHQTVSKKVYVTGATISQLISSAAYVKNYYELHGVLPSHITIFGQTITMPQFLTLLVTGTLNIKNGNLNPLPVLTVNPASNPSGNFTTGKIYKSEYLSIAQTIKNYISANGKVPNNATTSLGTIPFSKLVYSYSKIINYYGVNKELPNYVSAAT